MPPTIYDALQNDDDDIDHSFDTTFNDCIHIDVKPMSQSFRNL